jgi:hypothetical protein
MTVTLHFPDDIKAALQARADALGVSIEDWLQQVAAREIRPAPIANLQRTNPDEWVRQLRAWVQTTRPPSPLLPEEATSRESIYPDRD